MSKARNLARLIVDSSGDVDSSALSNVPASDDASALTTGTLDIARIANGAVTATKLASGAAATNLGNYVSTFNGSTGAVTGVASFNGSTGAVSYTAPVTSVNGQTGAVSVSSGMSVDTNTSSTATTYTIGTYVLARDTTIGINSDVTSGWLRKQSGRTIFSITNGGAEAELIGTWRGRGGEYYYNVHAQLLQRVA